VPAGSRGAPPITGGGSPPGKHLPALSWQSPRKPTVVKSDDSELCRTPFSRSRFPAIRTSNAHRLSFHASRAEEWFFRYTGRITPFPRPNRPCTHTGRPLTGTAHPTSADALLTPLPSPSRPLPTRITRSPYIAQQVRIMMTCIRAPVFEAADWPHELRESACDGFAAVLMEEGPEAIGQKNQTLC
jgi:hypothetical protein